MGDVRIPDRAPDGGADPGPAPPAAEESIRLLVVEDDEDDFLITQDLIEEQNRLDCTLEWSSTYDDALEVILEQGHDVYLVDYRLGGRTGLELIREGFANRPVAPIIMLTGQPRSEIDPEANALGATDYLSKRGLTADQLASAIRNAIVHHRAERGALAARAPDEAIWEWDIAADRLYLSPVWQALLGEAEEGTEGRPAAWFDRVAPDDLLRLRNEIEAHLAGQTPALETEFRMRHRDGGMRWVSVHGLATRDVDGTAVRIAGAMTDTTDRHATRERLEHEALHDTLTGLPNRTLFTDRVEQTLQRAAREASAGCALLFLDLDEFKQINDSLSHAVGDELLVGFAGRIASALRPGDTVARLGGDEFTVLLEEIVKPAEATVIAERILRSLDEPFQIDGNELSIGVSVGISLSADGLSPADLISAADLAMYDAKRQGRGRWAIFDEHMHRRVTDRLARQDELREILEHELLEVHYQPIVSLDESRIVGLEALARWPEDREALEPSEFIAIAEETGLIGALGERVMRVALQSLADWESRGLADDTLWVSVNLSARQLADAGAADRVRGAVRDAGLAAGRLRLEVVERTLAALERSEPFLAALAEGRIGLHIDDYGTGYSSLTALHRLPIRALKIDRGLVATLDDPASRGIVRSVVALAHSLDVAAIGAGIETEAQRDALRGLDCDGGQGNHLAPVLSGAAVAELLARRGATV